MLHFGLINTQLAILFFLYWFQLFSYSIIALCIFKFNYPDPLHLERKLVLIIGLCCDADLSFQLACFFIKKCSSAEKLGIDVTFFQETVDSKQYVINASSALIN